MNKIKISFITQIAKDYDMTYDEVEKIYNEYGAADLYSELEVFIENRSR